MLWIIGAVAGGFFLMALVFVIAIMRGKKNNVTYLIFRSFNRRTELVRYVGYIQRLPNSGELMSEAYANIDGKMKAIGKFHQKYMHPLGGRKYVLLLEEFDIGRYRPLQLMSEFGQEIIKKVKLDENMSPIYDLDGNPIWTDGKSSVSLVEPVSNDDFDWTLKERERLREHYKNKEEQSHWLKYVAAGALFFILGMSMIASAWWNYQTTIELKEGTVQNTALVTKMIKDIFLNQTIQESVKDGTIPPPPPG